MFHSITFTILFQVNMRYGVLWLVISISVAASLEDVSLRFFPSAEQTEFEQRIKLKQLRTSRSTPEIDETTNRAPKPAGKGFVM